MRFILVGSSCSGKSTFAHRLSSILDIPHIELDALHWGPNWTPVPKEAFRKSVADAVAAPTWVCDGNYRGMRDLIWPRGTVLLWLDYAFPVVLYRAFARTLKRLITREELFGGSRESVSLIFDRDWIPWWVMRTFRRRRRELSEDVCDPRFQHLGVVKFCNDGDGDAFLKKQFAATAMTNRENR